MHGPRVVMPIAFAANGRAYTQSEDQVFERKSFYQHTATSIIVCWFAITFSHIFFDFKNKIRSVFPYSFSVHCCRCCCSCWCYCWLFVFDDDPVQSITFISSSNKLKLFLLLFSCDLRLYLYDAHCLRKFIPKWFKTILPPELLHNPDMNFSFIHSIFLAPFNFQ